MTAGATGSSLSSGCSSPTTSTSSSFRRIRGSGSSPMRSFGPCRSAISASAFCSSDCTSRTARATSACWSCVPCEKFIRNASTPASTSVRSESREDDAGPMVATIFVLRGSTDITRSVAACANASAACPRERVPARIDRLRPQLLLDAEELVVLRDAVGARRRAGLDLAGAERDGEVSDRRVLRLAGAVRHHGGVTGALREPHRLDRLRERPDLVHLHEDRVGDAALDPVREPRGVRDEEVVADELHAVAELGREAPPGVP